MAMRASAACRLPTCLCSSPARERMKTSYSGQSLLMPSLLKGSGDLRRAGALLGRVRRGRLAHPVSGVVSRPARLQALAVAGAVALEHRVKLVPVDRADEVVLRALVPAQLRVGNAQTEELCLRHGNVDELLPQLVVAEALDLPAHRLRGVFRVGIARPEHHD